MRVVSYRTDAGVKCAIVEDIRGGRLRVLIMGLGAGGALGVRSVPGSEARYMTDLERAGKPYNLRRAAAGMARYAKTHGATKAAKQMLARARK